MSDNKYWQGLEELRKDPEFEKNKHNEFTEELPILEVLNETVGNQPTKRRDFLKYMGFSVSAAVLAASCEVPVRKAIPYVFKPEEVTPGVANYYASTFADGNDYCSILVKTREGRPIKIEGNTLSSVTKGGTNARTQASVLGLYDDNRVKAPMIGDKTVNWLKMDTEILSKLKAIANSGKDIVILSNTILSPSTKKLIEDFKGKYATVRHVQYDPVSYSGMLDANEKTFGQRVLPSYHFDKAKVIVGFDADFLGTWISPVQFAKQYSVKRKLNSKNPSMSRHIQVESNMTITGSNADTRIPLKPSRLAHALVNLHNEIAGSSGGASIGGGDRSVAGDKIKSVAKELLANKGASLVVCGSNDENLQMITNSINQMLGNYGTTLNISKPSYYRQGNDKELLKLISDMEGSRVGAIMIYNCNPAYDLPISKKFSEAVNMVQLRISFNSHHNETNRLAEYICPNHHYLESWSDAEPVKGSFSLGQPTISNIFNTRQAEDSILTWMQDQLNPADYDGLAADVAPTDTIGLDTAAVAMTLTKDTLVNDTSSPQVQGSAAFTSTELPKKRREYNSKFYPYIQKYWETNVFSQQSKFSSFQTFWDKALHDGVFEAETIQANTAGATTAFSAGETSLDKTLAAYTLNDDYELSVYEKVGIGNGYFADNPWLQELPDPVTKATWDNYVLVSIADAEREGLELGDVITVSANDTSITLPVVVQPGQPVGSLGIAVGYGRAISGKAGIDVGKNVYPLLPVTGNAILRTSSASMAKTGDIYPIAQTQIHHVISSENDLDKRTIIKEGILANLDEVKKNITEQRKAFLDLNEESLYPGHEEEYKRGHHWYMSIDMNSCIGCGACAVACTVENNVPVVGKEEVLRVHEMHWLRIDRYYTGEDLENPDVVFQPMLCQHCDNAPCENVCPVAATTHSSEGINQMAYNRCIGTRYCANNCPYKVRRFNWFDYLGADSFPWNEHDPGFDMANDLTRMVLNPDVVVRGRGVMEKCSLCMQRIQDGKLTAKRENRAVRDGEIQTACMQACPTDAIIFGNGNEADSMVNNMLKDNRTFYVIEEVNTSPTVGYQAKIRNRSQEEDLERRKARNI